MAQDAPPRATTAQLRDDIDSGRTGDKVDFPDPAAAPLGTDDEAAGRPPKPAEVSMARHIEGDNAPSRAPDSGRRSGRLALAVLLLGSAAVVVVAVALS